MNIEEAAVAYAKAEEAYNETQERRQRYQRTESIRYAEMFNARQRLLESCGVKPDELIDINYTEATE